MDIFNHWLGTKVLSWVSCVEWIFAENGYRDSIPNDISNIICYYHFYYQWLKAFYKNLYYINEDMMRLDSLHMISNACMMLYERLDFVAPDRMSENERGFIFF